MRVGPASGHFTHACRKDTNPYTGEAGTATVAPQGDEFAYFTFSSAANPEVFVKALGSNSPESCTMRLRCEGK